MTTLLGPDGRPITQSSEYRKAPAPRTGAAFGDWAGRDFQYVNLPGGGAMIFDLSQLTLGDFRQMRWHPQVNVSLSILNFMLYQIEWTISPVDQSDSKAKVIASAMEENLRFIWPQMVGSINQAFWAGFAPTAIEWENNPKTGYIEITRFKDLVPEECSVNWKEVEGYAPSGRVKPKFRVYDGIVQAGVGTTQGWPIPNENSFWYPLLMENGDYYGRKLLKPAFMPWYFSNLVHLFANRYYERFGEPTPIGRAPFDQELELPDGGGTVTGVQAMETILDNLRSRSVVTLPSDRDPVTKEFEYTLEYLESQMRGVDFDRYLGRLDEEISMGMFTPILLFRSGDVGSNSLGVQHAQTFLWMLNGIYGDIKYYIDRYILKRWKSINFSPNAPDVQWSFRKLGRESQETVRAIVSALISGDKAMVDLDDLGQALGMTLTEVRQTRDDPSRGNGGPDGTLDDRIRDDQKDEGNIATNGEPRATGRQISARVGQQVRSAWKRGAFNAEFAPSLGFERRMVESLVASGYRADEAESRSRKFFGRMDAAVKDLASLGVDNFSGPADVMALVDRHIDMAIEEMLA